MKLQVLGVNGGNGVILHPFKNQLIRNIEPRGVFKTPDDIQWKLNFKGIPLETSFDRGAGLLSDRVDVIIGAPDCGHSSVLAFSRAKALADPNENMSLNGFVETVNDYEPKFFLMENLPKLLENWGKDINKVFPYHRLETFCCPVSEWGNSQVSRVRLVVIGIHRTLSTSYDLKFRLPKLVMLSKCKDLLKGLDEENPRLCHVRETMDTSICLYYKGRRNITAQEAKHLWLTEFRDEKRWPVNMPRMKNQPGVYRNFANDYPLTVRKQNRQFNHKGLMLSPREIARIQGIPDHFHLWYDPDRRNFSINKARVTTAKTPPYEIGQWFYNALSTFNL